MGKNISFNVLIFFLTLFVLTCDGFDKSEAGVNYRVAQSIIIDGTLNIDDFEDEFKVRGRHFSRDGKTYAAHEIGHAIFLIPVALLNIIVGDALVAHTSLHPWTIWRIQQFFFSFMGPVYAATSALLFYLILINVFHRKHRTSFFATLLLVTTTYFWAYSRYMFDGVLCSTFLLFSFLMLGQFKQKAKWSYLALAFVGLGFAFITRTTAILAVFVSLFYLVCIPHFSFSRKAKVFCAALAIFIPFVLWQCWYNSIRTGFFYLSPLVMKEIIKGPGNLWVGIAGHLLSPGKSIFVYAPLLILSFSFFRRFCREFEAEAAYIFLLGVFWILAHARLRVWDGELGWGPRYFVTVMPFLFIPFAVYLESIKKKIFPLVTTIALAGWGILLSLSSMISNWHFRGAYRMERGVSTHEWRWGFSESQAIDMIQGAVSNIIRLVTQGDPVVLENYDPTNLMAFNTVNIWPFSVVYAGVLWYFVLIVVFILLFLLLNSLRNILLKNPSITPS